MTSAGDAPKETLDALIEQYRAELEERPDDADAHYNIGLALTCEGRTQEAVEAFEAARRLAPDYAETYCMLAVLYARRGNNNRAIDTLQELLSREPDNSRAQMLLDKLQKPGNGDRA